MDKDYYCTYAYTYVYNIFALNVINTRTHNEAHIHSRSEMCKTSKMEEIDSHVILNHLKCVTTGIHIQHSIR